MDLKKPWINEKILRDVEKRRKYKNYKNNQGIGKYKELKNKIINRDTKEAREKWLEDRYQEIELLFKRNKMDQAFNEVILSLRTLIQKQIEFNNTFIAFINLEKAFNTVSWKELFKTLEKIGIDYRDIWIIHNIYKEHSGIIQVSDKSATAKIRNWLKQGCPLSPKLFNIYVEQRN